MYLNLKKENNIQQLTAIESNSRHAGNSTRQIDQAIQYLFQGRTIIVNDHYGTREASKFLIRRIVDRLRAEHPTLYQNQDRIIVDEDNLLMKLNLK